MMKTSILFIFCLLFISFASGAEYLETVQLAGNDCLSSITTLRSGDVVAAGVDFTSNDAVLLKLNASGAILNTKRISGSASDEALGIVATSDGGAVVVGYTGSFGAGNLDGFLMKIRPAGTIAWKRTFGTSGNEHILRIVQTADKGFIVLADADHDPNLNDIVIAKFNSLGRFVWRTVVSAAGFDHASDLRLTSDNGVIVAFASSFTDGVRSVLVKFTASGAVEWSRTYGSSGDHIAVSAFQTPDGSYYFTEIFTPRGSQRSDIVLSKLDSTGVPIWSRLYRSPGSNLNATVSPIGTDLLLAGNITAAGGRNSRGILAGLDENGNIQWRKKVKPDARPAFIGQPRISADGSILVSGCVGDRTLNNMDSLILKTRSNGQIQGGCSKLTNFALTSARFNLTSSEISLEQIPVPFLHGTPAFQTTNVTADESLVCSGQ
jgi:outer membrane protein assembly factor BamB